MTPEGLIRTARHNFYFAALHWAAMENGLFKCTDLANEFNWKIESEIRHLMWERSGKGFRSLQQ